MGNIRIKKAKSGTAAKDDSYLSTNQSIIRFDSHTDFLRGTVVFSNFDGYGKGGVKIILDNLQIVHALGCIRFKTTVLAGGIQRASFPAARSAKARARSSALSFSLRSRSALGRIAGLQMKIFAESKYLPTKEDLENIKMYDNIMF